MGIFYEHKHWVFNSEKNLENVHVNTNNSLKMKKLSYMKCSFLWKAAYNNLTQSELVEAECWEEYS